MENPLSQSAYASKLATATPEEQRAAYAKLQKAMRDDPEMFQRQHQEASKRASTFDPRLVAKGVAGGVQALQATPALIEGMIPEDLNIPHERAKALVEGISENVIEDIKENPGIIGEATKIVMETLSDDVDTINANLLKMVSLEEGKTKETLRDLFNQGKKPNNANPDNAYEENGDVSDTALARPKPSAVVIAGNILLGIGTLGLAHAIYYLAILLSYAVKKRWPAHHDPISFFSQKIEQGRVRDEENAPLLEPLLVK